MGTYESKFKNKGKKKKMVIEGTEKRDELKN